MAIATVPGRYIPGLCSVTFRGRSVAAVIAIAASCGLSAIEWGSDGHVPIGDLATADAVRAACAGAGLTPASYGSYLRAGAGNDDGHLAEIVDTAAALGAANIRVWGGPRGIGSAAASAEIWDRAAGELRTMAEIAAAHRIALSLEFHADTLVDTGPSAARLLERVAHPALFTKWQPTPGIPIAQALAEIATVGPWLSHIDVFARDDARTRFALEDHRSLWTAVFAAARPAPGWTAPPHALLEFVRDDAVAALERDAAFLHALVASGGDAR